MIEVYGNLWEYPADWLCLTTNPIINARGLAVMGAGVASQAAQRYPTVPKQFAERIKAQGNVVQAIGRLPTGQLLISFPVKHDWKEDADLDLIEESARQLRSHWDTHGQKCTVVIPRPGCGNGRLRWDEVKPRLEKHLDAKQFHVIELAKNHTSGK